MTQKAIATARSVNRWLPLLLLASAPFMLTVAMTIAHLALPSIQHTFPLNNVSLQWMLIVYVALFGGFLFLRGGCADLIFSPAAQRFAAAFIAPTALSHSPVISTEARERSTALGVLRTVGTAGGSFCGGNVPRTSSVATLK